MNVKERNNLWIKIKNFPLDEKDIALNFSRKLASQQNWSTAYTKRVIEEYKRFILLCCISANGASPSKAVDEVWHLHLTYTASYWIDFCKNTLAKDIHHHPSKGGSDENHKHEEWYKETLQLYKTIFGLAPPSDIWPRPPAYERITATDDLTGSNRIKKAVAIMVLPFIIIWFFFKTPFPFSLAGKEFLVFYFLLGLAVIAAYLVMQNERKILEITTAYLPHDATVFQMAYFIHGKHRGIQAAIVDLIRRNLLKVNTDKTMVVNSGDCVIAPDEQNPLVAPLLQQPPGSATHYEEIAASWFREESFTHPALDNLAEYAHRETPFYQKRLFFVVLISTGALRIIQGLYNDKPVFFLVCEIVVLLIALYIVTITLSAKIGLFKKVNALLQERIHEQKGYRDPVVNDFVINGTPAIAGFAEGFLLAGLFTQYSPLQNGNWSAGSWQFTGDGGDSSCSGGGSCGGGGCGGCGGGD